jgi:uncharacterized protein
MLLRNNDKFPELHPRMGIHSPYGVWVPAIIAFGVIYALFYYINHKVLHPGEVVASEHIVSTKFLIIENIAAFTCAYIFGIGLIISGMCNQDKIVMFLDFSGPDGWDPSLMGVMAGGVLVNTVTFYVLRRHKITPLVYLATGTSSDESVALCTEEKCPVSPPPIKTHPSMDTILKVGMHKSNLVIDWKLIIGGLIFGLGWGFQGMCPGPAFVNIGALSCRAAVFIPSLLGGVLLHEIFKSLTTMKGAGEDAKVQPEETIESVETPTGTSVTNSADKQHHTAIVMEKLEYVV